MFANFCFCVENVSRRTHVDAEKNGRIEDQMLILKGDVEPMAAKFYLGCC